MTQVPLQQLLDLTDSGIWGDEDTKNGISVLRSTNFKSDGSIDFSNLTFRTIEERKRNLKTIREGDILLEKSGGGPKQPVGRVCLFRGHELQHSFGNFIARLRPRPEVISEYLFYFLWHFHATGKTSHYQKQTTGIRNLEFKRFLTVEVPVPPLSGQRRIVDFLSRAEGIVRLRREAEKKATELIPALFLDMFGDPEENPKKWPVQSMKSLVSFVSGGTPPKSREDFWEGDLPWVSPKDMKRVGIDSAIDHVNRKVLTETSVKLIPVGSVLIVVRGMILVHTVPVAQSLVPITINQDMKALVPIQSVNGTYLLWSLRVRQAQLLSLVATAAHGTKKLDTDRLEAFSIPLPPLAAQEDFADKLIGIESIQAQQSAATVKAKAAFDALLSKAFS